MEDEYNIEVKSQIILYYDRWLYEETGAPIMFNNYKEYEAMRREYEENICRTRER